MGHIAVGVQVARVAAVLAPVGGNNRGCAQVVVDVRRNAGVRVGHGLVARTPMEYFHHRPQEPFAVVVAVVDRYGVQR